jgi:hypothetical protein
MNFCSEGGCNDIALTGNFCAAHSDPVKRAVRNQPRSIYDKWYSKSEWKGKYGIRGIKIRRNPFCETPGCPNRATQVHHLDDTWKQTGSWFTFMGGYDCELLQSQCQQCHSHETMRAMLYGPKKEEEKLPCNKA